jgi:hypothetical protein
MKPGFYHYGLPLPFHVIKTAAVRQSVKAWEEERLRWRVHDTIIYMHAVISKPW